MTSSFPVQRVLAPNPGPYTLEGTNTWIVGHHPAVVIDPGPADDGHVESVRKAAGPISLVLLTHHHPDHAPAAAILGRAAGAAVAACLPTDGERGLEDEETIWAGHATLRVIRSPGHSPDHVAFWIPEHRALFTGDAVLGRGTSVIDPPEGDMGAYLRSLERLLALGPSTLYPGHGRIVEDGRAKLREYLSHRALRQRQVLDGLRRGSRSALELVPEIYTGYPDELRPAAARSVLAHLLKLEAEGSVEREAGGEASEPVAHRWLLRR